jgi:transcription initiation factor TFIIH subunit 1
VISPLYGDLPIPPIPPPQPTKGKLTTAEAKLRAMLLASNEELRILHKQLVESNILSEDEFWQSRQELLDNESMRGFNQLPGFSTAMISDVLPETMASTGTLEFKINSTIMAHIFLEHPSIRQAYLQNVETNKMSNNEFWTRYCTYQTVLRQMYGSGSSSSNTTGPMTLAHEDEIFSQCAEEDDKIAAEPLISNLLNVDSINFGNHAEDGYHPPVDILMVPDQLNKSLPLIRKFNRHGVIVLENATKSKPGGKENTQPLSTSVVLDDLEDKAMPAPTSLNITNHREYFDSISTSSNDNGKEPTKIGDYLSEISLWKRKSPQEIVVDSDIALQILKEATESSMTLKNTLSNGPSKPKGDLSEAMKKTMEEDFLTTNELLRHFWKLSPFTIASLPKLERLFPILLHQRYNLESKVTKQSNKYYQPIISSLNTAIEKVESLAPDLRPAIINAQKRNSQTKTPAASTSSSSSSSSSAELTKKRKADTLEVES